MDNRCPTFDELGRLADGAFPLEKADELTAHAAACPACASNLEELERVDAALIESLARPKPAAPKVLRVAWAAAAAGLLIAWAMIVPEAANDIEAPAPEAAAPSASVGRVAMLEGEVSVRVTDADPLKAVVENQPLHGGEVFVTREGERAKLELPDHGELYVNEKTELRLPTKEDPAVRLSQGELIARKRDAAPLKVRTPAGVAELEGDARIRLTADDVRVAMLNGKGKFRRPNKTDAHDVSLGEELVVPRNERRPVAAVPIAERRVPEWQKKMQAVEFLDSFRAVGLSPVWRAQPKDARQHWSITDGVLTLAAPAEGPKRRVGSLVNLKPFEIDSPVTFEFQLRQPKPDAAGRSGVVLSGAVGNENKVMLRYSVGAVDETLEITINGKTERLWQEKRLRPDRGWVTVKLTIDPREISLQRNGVDRIRRAHGSDALPPLRLSLHSSTGASAGEIFETEFSRISVRREGTY